MKTLLIIVNTAIICYCIHLISTYDSMTTTINRAVFEAIAFN